MHIIAGTFRNRVLVAPKGLDVRPSAGGLREALFNICAGIVEGSAFLDLFAGSGAIGLEALSRGAEHASFVDSHRNSIRCIQDNVRTLGVEENVAVYGGDVFKVLAKLVLQGLSFDIIFADPPYRTANKSGHFLSQQVLSYVDQSPLLKKDGSLFIEDASDVAMEESALQSLKLKSSRRIGAARLHHYVKRDS